MKLLLEHGADPTLAPTRSGINPLMAAAGLGTAEQDTTGRLQDARASHRGHSAAARPRPRHQRPSHATAKRPCTVRRCKAIDDVIRFLAAKGAKLDTADKDGFTPLDVALGKAGGFGFSGQEGVVREGTAAVLARSHGDERGLAGRHLRRAEIPGARLQNPVSAPIVVGSGAWRDTEHNARRAENNETRQPSTATSRVLQTFRPNGRIS